MFSPRVKVKNLSGRDVVIVYKREGQDLLRVEGGASVEATATGGGVGASGGRQFGERMVSIAGHSRVSLSVFSNHQYDTSSII